MTPHEGWCAVALDLQQPSSCPIVDHEHDGQGHPPAVQADSPRRWCPRNGPTCGRPSSVERYGPTAVSRRSGRRAWHRRLGSSHALSQPGQAQRGWVGASGVPCRGRDAVCSPRGRHTNTRAPAFRLPRLRRCPLPRGSAGLVAHKSDPVARSARRRRGPTRGPVPGVSEPTRNTPSSASCTQTQRVGRTTTITGTMVPRPGTPTTRPRSSPASS